jgi:hypothetical protein
MSTLKPSIDQLLIENQQLKEYNKLLLEKIKNFPYCPMCKHEKISHEYKEGCSVEKCDCKIFQDWDKYEDK